MIMPHTASRPRLAYSLSGPKGRAALVFVNGLGGLRQSWIHQVRAFADRYRVLTFDNRGNGGSEAGDGPIDMGTFASDLSRVMAQARIDSAVVIGISMGGRVALEFALSDPKRVVGLGLVATTCGGGASTSASREALSAIRDAPTLDENGWMERVVPLLFGPRYVDRHRRRLKMFAAGRARNPGDPATVAAQWQANRDFDVSDRLGSIRVPCLIIHGDDDALCPPANAEVLQKRLPQSRMVRMSGAGHSPNIEAPDRFNEALGSFLNDYRADFETGDPGHSDAGDPTGSQFIGDP